MRREIAFWALFSLIVPQALRLRKNAPRFVGASGSPSGKIGSGDSLRLIGIGDSIISGVGADDTTNALVGRTASALADRLSCEVRWTGLGSIGAGAAKVRDHLVRRLTDEPVDYFVVSVGVNDITRLSPVRSFRSNLRGLLTALQAHSPDATIAIAGMPPLWGFPMLPQPLRAVFGLRAQTFEEVLVDVANTMPGVRHVPLQFDPRPERFSADGYHPSQESYREFGDVMADALAAAQSPGGAGSGW